MEYKAVLFNENHISTRVDWINNPKVNETMYFDLPASIINTKRWFKNNIGNNKRVDFAFEDIEGKIVAMGGFTDISQVHKNGEFYVMVNPTLQGQGIGKKTSIWMYNYAFSVLQLNKIYLYTNDDNIAAYTIYEKAGFVLEGVLREHRWKNDKFQNRRFYGLLKSEWENMVWKKEIIDDI